MNKMAEQNNVTMTPENQYLEQKKMVLYFTWG